MDCGGGEYRRGLVKEERPSEEKFPTMQFAIPHASGPAKFHTCASRTYVTFLGTLLQNKWPCGTSSPGGAPPRGGGQHRRCHGRPGRHAAPLPPPPPPPPSAPLCTTPRKGAPELFRTESLRLPASTHTADSPSAGNRSVRVTKTSQVHFFEIVLELLLGCMSAFSSCHSGEQCWTRSTCSRAAQDLSILSSGPRPPYPAAQAGWCVSNLNSARMKCREVFSLGVRDMHTVYSFINLVSSTENIARHLP